MNDDRLRAAAARFTADDRPFPPTPSEAVLLQLRSEVPPLPRGQHRDRRRARRNRARARWMIANPFARFVAVIALTTVLSVAVIGGCVWGAEALLDRSEPLKRPSRIVPMPTPMPEGTPR